jgi:hypothetical protein
MLASILGLFLLPPIVQNQNYHDLEMLGVKGAVKDFAAIVVSLTRSWSSSILSSRSKRSMMCRL